MKFGGKFEYARRLGACMAYLLAKQQDLAGMCAIDDTVKWEMPPGSSPSHLDRMFRALETNPEVLAVNQDELGKPAHRVFGSNLEVWEKELSGGALAVILQPHRPAPDARL